MYLRIHFVFFFDSVLNNGRLLIIKINNTGKEDNDL